MEWATVIVAGFGIAGTLAAATISPVVTARLARRDQRRAIYAETLSGLWTAHENAQTLSSIPGAELVPPPAGRLRHLDAQVRLVGGRRVRDQLRVAVQLVNMFEQQLFIPQLRERARACDPDAEPDSIEGIQARMALGSIADDLGHAVTELEARMRSEVA